MPTPPDRTQQTLDDLADLFLTGTDGPAAILPKALAPPEPTHAERETQPHPTENETEPTPQRAPETPRLEAVLLGNLPGMAHVWLTQYAQLLAERDGPVLLLTVNADHRHEGQTPGALEAELVEPRVSDVLHRFPDPDEADEQDWFAPFPQTGSARKPQPAAESDLAALLGFDATRTAVAERRTPPSSPKPAATSAAGLLRDLLADTDRPVATVLIYCDIHPREIDRLIDVGVWTLLTGADPTAVAAAQHGLETLAEADPQAKTAEVGVFVVGSPPDKSAAAADQIAAAAQALFDRPVATLGHLQKMRPAAVRTLGTFPQLDAQWTGLLATLDELETRESAPARAPIPEPSEPPVPEAETKTDEADAEQPWAESTATPAFTRAPEPQPDFEPESTPAEPIVRRSVLDDFFTQTRRRPQLPAQAERPPAVDPPAPIQPVDETPSPNPSPETEVPAAPHPPRADTHRPAADPDLPALLADADPTLDLRPLPVRCPEHPHLHLAVDAAGRLHLLARLADAEHPRPALLALTDARRWAAKHRALLRLAVPGSAESPADPVLHLFTDQPDQAVPLIAGIDPAIRLHLLQHLPLADGPTWLATPLQAGV